MPHGGHWKSPNSSNVTTAVTGPTAFGGSAPGGMDRDAVAAGDAELPGAAEVGAGDGGFETADSFNDQATATTAARTTRMMMKGSALFILIITGAIY